MDDNEKFEVIFDPGLILPEKCGKPGCEQIDDGTVFHQDGVYTLCCPCGWETEVEKKMGKKIGKKISIQDLMSGGRVPERGGPFGKRIADNV